MTRNKKIAVTGGIGSGKSETLAMLQKRGYPVFSCDAIYHDLLAEGDLSARIAEEFPDCMRGGTLNRSALSRRIFSDPHAKTRLEKITHPAIMERLFTRMDGYPLSFAEVPLLFEGGYESRFDAVIAVLRPKEERIRATALRDGLSESDVLARMAGQRNWEEMPACVIPLVNDGTREELERRLNGILAQIV